MAGLTAVYDKAVAGMDLRRNHPHQAGVVRTAGFVISQVDHADLLALWGVQPVLFIAFLQRLRGDQYRTGGVGYLQHQLGTQPAAKAAAADLEVQFDFVGLLIEIGRYPFEGCRHCFAELRQANG